jgi:hypothetical protein
MKMTWTFIKHGAIIAGFLLGAGSQLAFSQGGSPSSTPLPLTADAPVFVTVQGVACLDSDLNGMCTADEAPVTNVILRSTNGAMAVTDSSGRYSIRIPTKSDLDVTIPAGYKSVNGNLHQIRIQVIDDNNIDIALAKDDVSPVAAVAPSASSRGLSALTTVQDNGLLPGNIDRTSLLDAMIAVILVSFIILIAVLISLRRIYTKSLLQQSRALKDQQEKELDTHMQSDRGWQAIAEQIVADALLETVSIDEQVGVLDAAVDPNPRFTIATRDGRTIVFTTGPGTMKKSRLIRRGDRVVDVTAGSSISHTSVGVLWQHILAMRNMYHVTLPSSAHWYIVVHSPETMIALKQKASVNHGSAPRGSWLNALRGGH